MLTRKHYSWVKNFQALMTLPADRYGRQYCMRCSTSFRDNNGVTGKEKLAEHKQFAKCTLDEADDGRKGRLPKVVRYTKANGEEVVKEPQIKFES